MEVVTIRNKNTNTYYVEYFEKTEVDSVVFDVEEGIRKGTKITSCHRRDNNKETVTIERTIEY